MKFERIKAERCPSCDAKTIREECHMVHCNGQGFEVRTFECGAQLSWSPNFGQLETTATCPKDPDEALRQNKRTHAKQTLLTLLGGLDVDEKWKSSVRTALEYYR